ncbi:MAG TPA: glycosyltransferase [Nocardioidaceae bacterium]
MPATEMPDGRYLTCAIDVSPDYGGQTRALLMRNRLLVQGAGLSPAVLTFSGEPDYDVRREILLERGLMLPQMSLLNIYEHYREHDWTASATTGEALKDLGAYKADEQLRPDGSLWRTTYRPPGEGAEVHDYHRTDGTPFVRVPRFVFKEYDTWPERIQQVDRAGEVVGSFPSLGHWFRRWVRELTEDDARAFVFIDSRHAVPHLVPMQAPNIHLIYLMHNVHLLSPRRWDSPTSDVYARVLERIPGMDAMVTLTERQRDDIAQRVGRTSNLFVVPNPVDLPERRPDVARDPRRVTVVARLEPQKRLAHAVQAFARVVEKIPDARLDIYGSGSRLDGLDALVRRRDLESSVRLHGFDPSARESLWRSSAFIMSSAFEGYPLSTLESLSHGCPVVSYDIKYGPREQITDGVDGFLVPDGDVDQLAERITRLLDSPALVEEMSRAAIDKARQHGTDRFLSDWAEVVRAVIRQKASRTRLADVDLEVQKLDVKRSRGRPRLPSRTGGTAPGRFRPSDRLTFRGALTVRAKGPNRDLDSAVVELAALHQASGAVVELPLETRRQGQVLHVSSTVRLDEVLPGAAADDMVRLRLRLVWQNSSWQTHLSRALGHPPGLEVSYDSDDTLLLRRVGATRYDT